ncbi:MAG: endo-1,3-alpha-glucanase family glycosylhydrolase [Victivallaceae bacterium]|nr:endo-1,3-alpha-glucanase family glycosylhydrolase [Victivallaceae bacterium]
MTSLKKIANTLLCATLFAAATPLVSAELAGKKMAWAHHVPWHAPQNTSLTPLRYYNYPLLDVSGDAPTDWRNEFQQAKAQGIDGFFCDVVAKKNQPAVFGNTIYGMLRAAEGTDFQIGICLDVKINVDYQVNELARLLKQYGNHPNYPQYQGKPIVCTYTFLDWTVDEWKQIREKLKAKGVEIHLMANFATGYSRKGFDSFDSYLPYLDSVYLFSLPGLNGVNLDQTNSFYREKLAAQGKMFLPCIYPGYYGAWLNGRNDFYVTHRHLDTAHDTFVSAMKHPGDFLMYTTWNDHDETSYLPMLFTAGNTKITKAYSDAYKKIPPSGTTPEVVFAAHRELLAGTILRIEAMNLPRKSGSPVLVSGELVAPDKTVVGKLEQKVFRPDSFDRAEWLFDSADFARYPHLTARMKVRCGPKHTVVRLPAIFFFTGWLQNGVTVKSALSDLGELENTLKITSPAGGLIEARISYAAKKPVRRITLFRNDRPLAVPVKGKTMLPLTLEAPYGSIELDVIDGRIHQAVRKFHNNFSEEFHFDDTKMTSKANLSWMPIALLLEGGDSSAVAVRHGEESAVLSFAEIAKAGRVKIGNLLLSLAPAEATAQNDRPLASLQDDLTVRIYCGKTHRTDRFLVRYDFADGSFAWSEVDYPFARDFKAARGALLRTEVNLETPSGANAPPTAREFFAKTLPVTRTEVVDTEISPLLYRAGDWPFDGDGRDLAGDMPVDPIPESLFTDGFRGRGLGFTGKEKLKMRLRTAPMGACTYDFYMNWAAKGEKQSVISRTGWSDALNINVLSDGILEVVRNGAGKAAVVRGTTPVLPGKWTHIRVEYDLRAIRILVDGKEDVRKEIPVVRSYGNNLWHLGGGFPKYANFRGKLDELKVFSFVESSVANGGKK